MIEPKVQEPLIGLEELDFAYESSNIDGRRWRLRANDVMLYSGRFYSLRGPNMSGKSTFLSILQRGGILARADSKSIVRYAEGHPGRWAIQLIHHDDPMFPELSLWDNLRAARPTIKQASTSYARGSLRDFIQKTPVLSESGVTPDTLLGSLSSGGRALVKIARASVWGCRILLVDEATSNLDNENGREFISSLFDVVEQGGLAVLVSHLDRDHRQATEIAQARGVRHCSLALTAEPGGARVCEL
ncbi:MAG: ABC transporter ATP-binding protein [Phycisphaerales bacterium]